MAEYWRPIPGFNGWYEISTHAEIRSWRKVGGFGEHRGGRAERPQLLVASLMSKPKRTPKLCISLWDEKTQKKTSPLPVKDLMRDTWMGGKIPGTVIVIKNKDPKNCALHNLERVSDAESRKRKDTRLRRPVAKVREDGEVVMWYRSLREAAKKNYLTRQGLDGRIRRKTIVDGCYFTYASEI